MISDFVQYLERLIASGGPTDAEYVLLDAQLAKLHAAVEGRQLSKDDVLKALMSIPLLTDPNGVQGFGLTKPHGYAGDFEIIDRIYTYWTSPDPRLAPWDRYFHAQPAPKAVRNRKDYFHALLDRLAREGGGRVLKLGVGPGRSMYEWLNRNPSATVTFDCVELDPKAIEYARNLNAQHLDHIRFIQGNALRFKPAAKYNLIWAAGLLDYFDDRRFASICRRMLASLEPAGELVVGNFARRNTSRAYMELMGDWTLIHRSEDELLALATQAGACPRTVRVDCEPEGVNLFVHARAPD
ncbi:methyltransferase family protein [Luteimonas sp. J16]|uniref:class I SAM-dependent methyltransferase n=1 Tax=unclassified Luteimonas TaxID=2629088 RepID=UPI00047CC753|nr:MULTISPECIES: class I SAM-dependent methyltransferase [unclassified Luteimonas]TWG89056.1 methyltransferase family protein [Luteimonas sp. J16]